MLRNTQGLPEVHTLDLRFLGLPGTIASYLIGHSLGAILIETGPGSTLANLIAGLSDYGYSPADVTDVLVTHIHLDHAGAAGWLAQQGARIYVHPAGAPHLVNPERLLSSAARIYGDQMYALWGQFLPVPPDKLVVLPLEGEVEISGLKFQLLDTPGHAGHHLAYLYKGICFSGDVGGARLSRGHHIRLPTPPPEFHLEKWRASLVRLQSAHRNGAFHSIAPTHYGIFDDATWHLSALDRSLDAISAWMDAVMPARPSIDELSDQFIQWINQQAQADGLSPELNQSYEAAIPSWMSPQGIHRYWEKYRAHPDFQA
jgi:glyoxylase-like metal-dependent hydrolase (beta-lactamase superfamily II)